MRRGTKIALMTTWVIVATLGLTHLWIIDPDSFPHLPESFMMWAERMYQPQNGEEIADLEMIIGVTMWSTIVCGLTFLIWLAWRFTSQSHSGSSADQ